MDLGLELEESFQSNTGRNHIVSSNDIFFNHVFIFNHSYIIQLLKKNLEMPDPIDHATGLEKKELLAALAGNDDPYHMKPIKRGVGTKEKPTLIPSAFDARILGCICHEDQTYVQWLWLYKDVPKRCECGHWYKLYHVEPFVDESIAAMSDVH